MRRGRDRGGGGGGGREASTVLVIHVFFNTDVFFNTAWCFMRNREQSSGDVVRSVPVNRLHRTTSRSKHFEDGTEAKPDTSFKSYLRWSNILPEVQNTENSPLTTFSSHIAHRAMTRGWTLDLSAVDGYNNQTEDRRCHRYFWVYDLQCGPVCYAWAPEVPRTIE